MFDTFKIYINKEISQEEVKRKLVALSYKRVEEPFEEGDFSFKGDTLEVFPVNFNFPLRIEWEFEVIKKIYSFDKALRRKILDYDLLIIIPHFKKARRYSSEDIPLSAILQIKKNDFVVHSRYGIGKFRGMKKLVVKGTEGYYFEIEYDKKDKLYVAKEEAHLIQKYSNLGLRCPRLSRLGTKEWSRTKEKVQSGIKTFALEALKLEAQRKIIGGFKYPKDDQWQRSFEASFPYQETPDQIKATQDVKKDMESDRCMDRIICGDVGYGKTEVAMRAAFKAVTGGKQVVFLVPTTILAYQHYVNLKKRLADFPFYVEMLCRFRSPKEQKDILAKLSGGKIDIIVGTHRLLSGDVNFRDLGLLIIDEEHKFGVIHKERIKRMRAAVDILSLSATPIPRTLYMGMISLKDISLIRTPPKDRLAVKTKVLPSDPEKMKAAILNEVSRGGQIFLVNHRIETISKIERKLRKILPETVRIGVAHGRLSSGQLEEVMLKFIKRELDCLISTSIVESGIDIPTANTIIINNAHRFGLADLHQLRGRVGRFIHQAYAYLFVPGRENLSTKARNRIQQISEFSHLGAGFEVAMSDLELRGAGNVLGKQQHGFVWMVGFDLYCRLLKKEIEYLKSAFKINNN